jgi:malonyl-CoA O-methyltransferase
MGAERRDAASDPALPDPRSVRRAFARAAPTYDASAVLQHEVGARMIERLDVVRLAPTSILDAGCGTGDALGELAARYPKASRVALDVAMPMLAAARAKSAARRSLLERVSARWRGTTIARAPSFVCADVSTLPFAAASFDLVWSNLTLQWVRELAPAIGELHRVLAVGGLLTFTTFGPDTLKELRAAFAGVDASPHVGRFADMHDVGDLLVQTGFADPVMEMETITMTYAEPVALLRDLKAIGATNAAAGRRRGMTGRARFARALAALGALARDGRVPATFEVVYGHAWKAERTRTPEGHAIVRIERDRGRR